MSLTPGTLIGPYEVLGPLGAGGMGEVFRARDTRLARDVAIKALPPAFAQDPARLVRFEREAKLLASLSHPNIAGILGLEEEDGARYLILEFVEGETLAARIARGALPIDEACDVARQVAAGLEAAHENGVVHRDLKPGNVMLTPAGAVKVLDFGLAKAGGAERPGSGADAPVSASPTMTYAVSEAGVVMGTAAYMSPEQARGRPVDKRSDIWSFGGLLYECLTGRAIFSGETTSDTIAAILTREPDLVALPAATPPRVRALLERCLTRDPRERLRDIGEARIALAAPGVAIAGSAAAAPGAPTPKKLSHAANLAPTIFAAILAAVIGVVATRLLSRPAPPAPLALGVLLPFGEHLDGGVENGVIGIAADGRSLAYAAQGKGVYRLLLRRLDEREPVALPGTEGGHSPFLSPDGEWVAFFAGSKLKKLSVRGGTPVDLADIGGVRGGTWLDDGTIVYSPTFSSPLYRIPADGGTPVAITRIDSANGERTHRWPSPLRGGEWIVFTVGAVSSPGDYEDASIEVVSLKSGERRKLAVGNCAKFAPPGRLIISRRGSLYSQPIDPRDPRGGGTPVPVFDGVLGHPTAGLSFFDLARDGTLILVPGRYQSAESRLAWMDLDGRMTMAFDEPRSYDRVDISPDGTRAVTEIGPGGGGRSNLVVLDLVRGQSFQVTFDDRGASPLWLPDGKRAVWVRQGLGEVAIVIGEATGADSGRVVARMPGPIQLTDVSPDGSFVVFSSYGTVDSDVERLFLDGSGRRDTLVAEPRSQIGGTVSPDGRWIAFTSDAVGDRNIWIRPLGRPGNSIQVTRDGGLIPIWAPDGRAIYHITAGGMNATTLLPSGDALLPEAPRRLFDMPILTGDGSLRDVALHPSETKFLIRVAPQEGYELREIAVMPGWSRTLAAAAKGR